jgi:Heparinase II/III-like protein/Heparinase II/III N-terminus
MIGDGEQPGCGTFALMEVDRVEGARAQRPRFVSMFGDVDVGRFHIENARRDTYTVRGREIELLPPVDWRMDPYESWPWRFWLHSLQFLAAALVQYSGDGEVDMLLRSRDLVIDWLGANLDHNGSDDQSWYDQGVGIRAGIIGYVRRACLFESLLSVDQRALLDRGVLHHAAWLADDKNYAALSNHGLYQDAGLFTMAQHCADLPGARQWELLAQRRFMETLSRHVDLDEGLHREHSPSYHFYVLELLQALRPTGLGGERLAVLVDRMERAAGRLALPDGVSVPFGDSDLTRAPTYAVEAPEWHGLAAFLDTGYAAVRHGDSMLAVSGAYHAHAHKHADELTWCLYEHGTLLVGDAARYSYTDEQAPARVYARSSQAHNVLTLDGNSFPWKDLAPYGSALEAAGAGDGWYAVLGRNPFVQGHRRVFLYRPGSLLVIVDDLELSEEHRVDRWVHLGRGVSAVRQGPRAFRLLDDSQSELGSLTDHSPGPLEVTVERGARDPWRGWVFPTELHAEPVDTVALTTRTSRSTLVHAVNLRPQAVPRIHARTEAAGITVQVDDQRALIIRLDERRLRVRTQTP